MPKWQSVSFSVYFYRQSGAEYSENWENVYLSPFTYVTPFTRANTDVIHDHTFLVNVHKPDELPHWCGFKYHM